MEPEPNPTAKCPASGAIYMCRGLSVCLIGGDIRNGAGVWPVVSHPSVRKKGGRMGHWAFVFGYAFDFPEGLLMIRMKESN